MKIPLEQRTEENFQSLIQSVQLPFMFIDYRSDLFLKADDNARQQYLLLAAQCGSEVIDVMGDLYDSSPLELTHDPAAIEKQKALISRIHELGAKVIMSSHMTSTERSAEEVLEHLNEQILARRRYPEDRGWHEFRKSHARRGADPAPAS